MTSNLFFINQGLDPVERFICMIFFLPIPKLIFCGSMQGNVNKGPVKIILDVARANTH